jgi:hypothetical protein
MEKSPFNKKILENHIFNKSATPLITSKTFAEKMVASPSLKSKFTPSQIMSKSPLMVKRSQFGPKGQVESKFNDAKNLLGKFAGPIKKDQVDTNKNNLMKYAINTNSNPMKIDDNLEEEKSETILDKDLTPIRKNRNFLKNLDDVNKENKLSFTGNVTKNPNSNYDNLSILPAKKQEGEDSDGEKEEQPIKFEGYLYKITTSKKLKKLWFKLLGKEVYCKNK